MSFAELLLHTDLHLYKWYTWLRVRDMHLNLWE